VAGPFYVVASLTQAVTRTGFSLTHDEWSLLALGHLGWIQVVNFILTGAMTVAGAIGIRRAVGRGAAGGTWAPRLVAGYGLALVGAGIFRADPANGFPSGAPAGRATAVSWHGTLHVASGSLGFACLIAACFVIARSYSRGDQHRAAVASRIVGVAFAVAFGGVATGAGSAAIIVAFTLAVVATNAWMTIVAVDLYRQTRRNEVSAATRRR